MSETCNRKKFGFFGLTIMAVVLAGGVALATGAVGKPGFMGGHGHWGHHSTLTEEDMKDFGELFIKRFSRHAGATEEQKAALQKELDTAIPKIRELQQRKTAVHDSVIAALAEDQVDRAKLERARAEAAQLAADASTLILDTTMAVTNILTPEQRKALVERVKKRHKG